MVGDISFAFIITVKNGGMLGFREAIESIKEMDYPFIKVHILDATSEHDVEDYSKLLVNTDDRIEYHRMQPALSMAALWNQGIRYTREDYLIFVGPMVRLEASMPRILAEYIASKLEVHILYSDYDEIIDNVRMNPQFLPEFNLEYFRHTNYIGDTIVVKRQLFRQMGMFTERLHFSFTYDFFLRAYENRLNILHVPHILWHSLTLEGENMSKGMREFLKKSLSEHKNVLMAHFSRLDIKAEVEPDQSLEYFKIKYYGDDYKAHRREYLLVRESGILVLKRRPIPILYGHLKQDDVAIVGVRFVGPRRTIDNCGYIYDNEGMIYPACYGQQAKSHGLYGRIAIPSDVSMVDPEYCMIDAKFFRKAGGFDRNLSGKEMMMDLCMQARKGGMRVVYEPMISVRRLSGESYSNEQVHNLFYSKWRTVIEKGDPYYNQNLPMGLSNYEL
ncbi:MAG: hypothetical protein K6F00_00325 [Lachnospiraceae bacterium]|nr:hypothetical protein [Lachnospiraceae bacterium]